MRVLWKTSCNTLSWACSFSLGTNVGWAGHYFITRHCQATWVWWLVQCIQWMVDECAKGCKQEICSNAWEMHGHESRGATGNRAKCLALLSSTMEKHKVPYVWLYNADQTVFSSINYQTESTLIGMTRTFMELSKWNPKTRWHWWFVQQHLEQSFLYLWLANQKLLSA